MTEYNTRPRRLPIPSQVPFGAAPAQEVPGSSVIDPTLLTSGIAAGATYLVASNFTSFNYAISLAAAAFIYTFQWQQVKLPRAVGRLPRYPDSYEQISGGASSY